MAALSSCPPQCWLLLSVQPPWHSRQRPSVRGPSFQTRVQLSVKGSGKRGCRLPPSGECSRKGPWVPPRAPVLPVRCGEFPGVAFAHESPYSVPQCPHCKSGLQWFSTLTFKILGQACCGGCATCCGGQPWQMGPMCLEHSLWSGTLVPKLHPTWLCMGDRWRAVSLWEEQGTVLCWSPGGARDLVCSSRHLLTTSLSQGTPSS